MHLLAFDTSTEWCSAALWMDGRVIDAAVHAGQAHSRLLLPMVSSLLAEAGLTLGELDGIAFGRGPGSFTGVRIACGVAQGLALGASLPLLGVSTLEAMAEEADAEQVVTCLDARMNEIYAAVWRRDPSGWQAETEAMVCPPAVAPLPTASGYVGCGGAFAAYPEILARRYADLLTDIRPGLIPHARSIARLAAPRFRAGMAVPPEAAEPVYVRDKVALTIRERTMGTRPGGNTHGTGMSA
ncbi:MAG TPA: tRNA (adenosine(37)-N6)-threonylcarbamoyltransferase complex dimerization subunit type 1 TsaB [Thiobacillaceae bacterium]|nr:tRNA (adenosine(37)-N6)-threonylcarbamoyltransferase complex dimerization subunit type 1 TsaB [Thiobacillaceae bacterium]